MLRIVALGLGLVFVSGSAMSGSINSGHLALSDVRAIATPPSARAGAAYMVISNAGDTDDRLLSVRSEAYPNVQIHRTEIDGSVARMVHVEAIEIPAGASTELAPGGAHVMFMGIKGSPFEVGDVIPVQLVFEKGGIVDVVIPVLPISEAQGQQGSHGDHSGHEHGASHSGS